MSFPLLMLAAAVALPAPGLPPYTWGPILSLADPAPNQPEIDSRYTPAYKHCLARPDLSTMTQDQCNGQEMKRQDTRLNAVWVKLFKGLAPARQIVLRSAERAWIGDRKAHCDAQAKEGEGGTIETLLYGSCMIDETIRRTIWLEKLR